MGDPGPGLTPPSHYFFFGPRGTGKSTWLKQRYPDALWIDLLAPDVQRELAARPEGLRRRLALSYVALYLREEVQMEGIVRNIGAFARFLSRAWEWRRA